jgi:MoxR-like ATPase
MVAPHSEVSATLDHAIADGLRKPFQDRHRLDLFAQLLATSLEAEPSHVGAKLVRGVAAVMENRVGEWYRGPVTVGALLIAGDGPNESEKELRLALQKAYDVFQRRWPADGALLLFSQPDTDKPWVLRAVVEARSYWYNRLKQFYDGVEHVRVGSRSTSGRRSTGRSSGPGELPIWIEFTSTAHEHGGAGWEFGRCLWSPSRDRNGRDTYSAMRLPNTGDLVVHILDGRFVGTSRVASRYTESTQPPPNPGPWAGRPSYYRIDVSNYRVLERTPTTRELIERHRDEIAADVDQNKPPRYLFVRQNGALQPNQGRYLSQCSPTLYQILMHEIDLSPTIVEPPEQQVAEPEPVTPIETTAPEAPAPYLIEEALEDLFIDRATFECLLRTLERKRNIVLEGAPGVGKTFVARRLAYAFLKVKDRSRVELVEFHPSYSYEEFVRGWRPGANGSLAVLSGAFLDFCERARHDPDRPRVLIIDEINRGDLAKIFGETLMLLEADKRNEEFAVQLAYRSPLDRPFYIPPNVYLIGTMNTADRSLALVDYALRRRFAFFRLEPAFERPQFREYLSACGVDETISQLIVDRMTALNTKIGQDDRRLGPGYAVGHSFFCPPKPARQSSTPTFGRSWYADIVEYEIAPLLRTYWLDDPGSADNRVTELLAE